MRDKLTPKLAPLMLLMLSVFASVCQAYQDICGGGEVVLSSAPDHRAMSIICSDRLEELPELDRTLNGYYRAAMERVKDRKALQREQQNWLKQRNACETKQCIGRAYHWRILELALVPAKAAVHSFKSGTFAGAPSFFLTKEMGLKYFDGGKSDYDIVAIVHGNEHDQTRPCKNRFDLIGTGISVYAPCKGPEYGVSKPIATFDGKKLQLLTAHEFNQGVTNWLKNEPEFKESLLHDPFMARMKNGGRIMSETIGDRLSDKNKPYIEPFEFPLTLVGDSKEIIWQWHIIRRNSRPASKFTSKMGQRPSYSDHPLWAKIQLADGSVLMSGSNEAYRLDPTTGVPYDTINIRTFSIVQALSWKADWARDYLTQNPACGGDIKQCIDQRAALAYLWRRFNEEMDRQFAISAAQ